MWHALVPSSSLETSPLPLMSNHSSAKAQRNQNHPSAKRGRCMWRQIVWQYATRTLVYSSQTWAKNKKYNSSNHRNIGLGDMGRLRSIIEANAAVKTSRRSCAGTRCCRYVSWHQAPYWLSTCQVVGPCVTGHRRSGHPNPRLFYSWPKDMMQLAIWNIQTIQRVFSAYFRISFRSELSGVCMQCLIFLVSRFLPVWRQHAL